MYSDPPYAAVVKRRPEGAVNLLQTARFKKRKSERFSEFSDLFLMNYFLCRSQ